LFLILIIENEHFSMVRDSELQQHRITLTLLKVRSPNDSVGRAVFLLAASG
jgi:hypothetical protein